MTVAPRVGAWIETSDGDYCPFDQQSHPVWVRGLKPARHCRHRLSVCVAPRVGAWIETAPFGDQSCDDFVAPRVGAWIETLIKNVCVVLS